MIKCIAFSILFLFFSCQAQTQKNELGDQPIVQSEGLQTTPTRSLPKLAISPAGYCQVLDSGALRCRELSFTGGMNGISAPKGTNFVAIARWRQGYCALRKDQKIECWRGAYDSIWMDDVQFEGKYVEIAGEGTHVCAITVDGKMECAARENLTVSKNPGTISSTTINGSGYHSMTSYNGICALSKEQAICVAGDRHHRLNHLKRGESLKLDPKPFVLRGEFKKIVRGFQGICALTFKGKLKCRDLRRKGVVLPDKVYVDLIANKVICALEPSGVWQCGNGLQGPTANSSKAEMKAITPGDVMVWLDDEGHVHGSDLESKKTYRELYTDHGRICVVDGDEEATCTKLILTEFKEYESVAAFQYGFIINGVEIGHTTRRRRIKGAQEIYGQLGDQNTKKKGLSDVQDGYQFGCGLKKNGLLKCWGNIRGATVRPPKIKLTKFALGASFGCGLDEKGNVNCWGQYLAVKPVPKKGRFVSLRTSSQNVCAERDDGKIFCWGSRFLGLFELPIIPTSYGLSALGVCAVDVKGEFGCWGMGILWQDGN